MAVLRYLIFMAYLALPAAAPAADSLIMAASVSIRDSGLLDYLRPFLLKETGIDLKWQFIDAGAVLKHGRNCEADVLFVHAPAAEQEMMEKGLVVDRRRVMLSEEEGGLLNPYSVMTVNPAQCPRTRAQLAKKFTEWLVCPPTQSRIAAFTGAGGQRFFPDAPPPSR
jgi:ABC-type tungstate transport system permease subunit